MDASKRVVIEWECQRLSAAVARYLDERRYGDLIELFSPDALVSRDGRILRGRAAILQALQSRPADVRTRHFCASPFVEAVTEAEARAVVYGLTYFGRGDPPGGAVPYAPAHGTFVEYVDWYRRTAEGWRIAERIVRPALVSGVEPPS
jgi:hypothetical protein